MSCYLLEIEKYEQIKADWQFWIKKIIGRREVDPAIFNEMYGWNQRAINDRYRENNPIKSLSELNLVGSDSAMRLYKNLRCLCYQCSDAEGWEKSDTCKDVKEMLELIASWIITDLPEYRQLPW